MARTRRFAYVVALAALVASGPAPAPAQGLLRAPCDSLDKALCLFPFPNDRFTRPDSSAATGRRIAFQLAEMPRSIAGKPIDPTEWNRNDGFSPGSMVLTFVPGLDLHQTWGTASISQPGYNDPADHIADIGRYARADAPILLIDADTGERWPFWSELDMNAQTQPSERVLILRPARNFLEGQTYLVALRTMRDASGKTIPASPQYAAYRDNTLGPSDDPTFDEFRRAEVNAIIAAIESAERARGNAFDRSELYLSWQFTIASADSLAGRVLHIRDDAFAQLGDTNLADGIVQGVAPRFAITEVIDKPGDTRRLREVRGTVTVPNYLDRPPGPLGIEEDPVLGLPMQAIPAGRFLYGPDGMPIQNPAVPTIDVPFVCVIPRAASAADPAHPYIYGHGLLGSRYESTGGSSDRLRERNFMPCATNWMGFAEYDFINAAATLADPSNMPSMTERSQQGFVNMMYVSRAVIHPNGILRDEAFRDPDGSPLVRSGELFYDGNSQGGIMGGALCALSLDITRCTLGVVGMNYSTLLNRSVDWEGPLVPGAIGDLPSYSSVLYTMFPNKQEQQLVIAILQMLWDRAEGDGYAQHMTADPLPNTPSHQVLLHVAVGDFQVTNVSAEVEGRTIGARFMDSALMPGRHWSADPTFGFEPWPRNADGTLVPWNGSALVYWDSGNYLPPNANIPPREDGGDPHEDPRRDPRSGDQRALFYLTGAIHDVMGGGAYLLCRPGQEANIPRVPSQFGFDWC